MAKQLFLCALVLAWVAGFGTIAPAGATFYGGNGQLVVAPGDPAGFNPLHTIGMDLKAAGMADISGTDELVSPAWSKNGRRLVAVNANSHNLYLFNPDGSGRRKLTNEPPDDCDCWSFYSVYPSWSPASDRIAYGAVRSSNWDIYTVTTGATPVERRLTSNAAVDRSPAWSPDGSLIAFMSDRSGNFELYVMKPDGTGLKRLTSNTADDRDPSWSPDGSRLLFIRNNALFTYDLAASTAQPVPGAGRDPVYNAPEYSPDGMYIGATYFSDRVALLHADGTFIRESEDDAAEPTWQPLGCTVTGTTGADTLVGTSGADVICGKSGSDTIDGRGGNDTIFGDAGNDVLKGGAGADALVGGAGADNLQGGDGTDRCDGGLNTDPATTSCARVYRVP